MTAQLPTVGGDDGQWGTILNTFLLVAHNADGTLQASALPAATSSVPGAIQLAGDLSGTATAPTVNGLSTAEQTTNKNVANGYAPLNGSVKVPTANLGSGTASSSTYLRGDSTWAAVSGSATNATSSAPGLIQLSGDLSGSATAPTVAKVNGVTVTGTPASGNVITASSSTAATWSAPSGGSAPNASTSTPGVVQLSGDLGGTYTSPSVLKVNGISVSGTPASGNVITASSTTAATWTAPAVATAATTTASGVITLAGDLAGTSTSPSVAKLKGVSITNTASNGTVLTASSSTAASWSTPTGGGGNSFNPTHQTSLTGVSSPGGQGSGASQNEYDASNYDWVIADATNGQFNVYLPVATSGYVVKVLKNDSTNNSVSVNTRTGSVIPQPGNAVATSYNISGTSNAYSDVDFYSDGTNWYAA